MAKINNQSQTAKQGFDIPAIAKEVERVYGIYNQNIVRTVLEQAHAIELLQTLQGLMGNVLAMEHIDKDRLLAIIQKAQGGTK